MHVLSVGSSLNCLSCAEMHCLSGKVIINKAGHQVAYCAQNPCEANLLSLKVVISRWIGLEHATIRDNIIFGSAYGYDGRRYQAVIEACALKRDLEIFEAGDMTGQPRLAALL